MTTIRRQWLRRANLARNRLISTRFGRTIFAWAPVVVCSGGLLLSLFAFERGIETERRTFLAAFQRAAQDRIAVVENDLNTSTAMLEAIRAFWENSDDVSEHEFETFVREINASFRSSVRFVEWLPCVRHEDRPEYERRLALRGQPIGITELAPDRTLRPAGVRAEYFPVTYFVSYRNTAVALGYDSFSNLQAQTAVEAARRTRRIAATSKTVLLQDAANVPSILLYAAVKHKQRPAGQSTAPGGLVALAVTVPNAVEFPLSLLEPAGVDLALEEVSPSGAVQTLYRHKSRLARSSDPPGDTDPRLTVIHNVSYADRFWRLRCRSIRPLDGVGYGWRSTTSLILGILLSLALGVFTSMVLTSDRRIRFIVKRRTQRLREATRAARAASAAKSRFIANLGHEVRTPLNGIMGVAQHQLQNPCSPEVKDNAEIILDASSHLLDVVNDLLDVAKAEAGRMQLRRQPISLRAEVKKICTLYRDAANNKGLTFECSVADAVPDAVFADGFRLRQVLLNLVGNAVKFTSTGGITVNVGVVGAAASPVRVRFQVTDTGIGVSPEDQARVFDAFIQADDADNRRHQGTGLGLTICRHLVHLMGGEIGCESARGAGSTFWFEIPFELAASPVAPASVTPSSGAEEAEMLEGCRVLVAEDNILNQRVLQRFLERLKCNVQMTGNGAEAVDAFRRQPFDIVLLDLQMPEMDGRQAARIIRELGGARVPIIAISAASGPLEATLPTVDFDDFLPKPIHFNQLAQVLPAGSARRKRD